VHKNPSYSLAKYIIVIHVKGDGWFSHFEKIFICTPRNISHEIVTVQQSGSWMATSHSYVQSLAQTGDGHYACNQAEQFQAHWKKSNAP
jgi:hypothetical protein